MPWVGHSLALLTVPRFLMIPGDRASTSNEPQRGAEPCSGTPCTPKKFQSRFEPPWPSGGKICLQRDAVIILVHPGLVGTCRVPSTTQGHPEDTLLRKQMGLCPRSAQQTGGMRYSLKNYKPGEGDPPPRGTAGRGIHVNVCVGGSGVCDRSRRTYRTLTGEGAWAGMSGGKRAQQRRRRREIQASVAEHRPVQSSRNEGDDGESGGHGGGWG